MNVPFLVANQSQLISACASRVLECSFCSFCAGFLGGKKSSERDIKRSRISKSIRVHEILQNNDIPKLGQGNKSLHPGCPILIGRIVNIRGKAADDLKRSSFRSSPPFHTGETNMAARVTIFGCFSHPKTETCVRSLSFAVVPSNLVKLTMTVEGRAARWPGPPLVIVTWFNVAGIVPSNLVNYWLLMVAIVPSNFVMWMVNGSL